MKLIAFPNIFIALVAFSIGGISRSAQALPSAHDAYPHSSQNAAFHLFDSYLEAKNTHNGSIFVKYFDAEALTYCDAVLGACPTVSRLFQLDNSWANTTAEFYLLEVYGNTDSAILHFVATSAAFGQEIRTLSAVDLKNRKITRQIDYWSARNNSVTPPCPEYRAGYSSTFGLDKPQRKPDQSMQRLAKKLNSAFAADDADAAAALFDYNATFEDLALRVALDGQREIHNWLQLALPIVPYGRGTTVRHVLGGSRGGGYEWGHVNGAVPNGIVALSVNRAGKITALKAVWDASCLSDWEFGAMLLLPLSL